MAADETKKIPGIDTSFILQVLGQKTVENTILKMKINQLQKELDILKRQSQ